MNLDKKAQAGLEYLMTYGWAIVLVATIFGAFALVAINPSEEIKFFSTDSTKIMMKAGGISDGIMELRLQNITGGKIEIVSITAAGYQDCSMNGESLPLSQSAQISPGIEIAITCNSVSSVPGPVYIAYKDYVGFPKMTKITVTGEGKEMLSGLVAYWPAANDAKDYTENMYNGTLNGNISFSQGKSGSGFEVNGSTDYVSIPAIGELGGSAVTMTAWVNVDSFNYGSWNAVLTQYDETYEGYYLYMWNDHPAFWVGCGGALEAISNESINTGQWYHLAGTYDGENLKIYVDGNLKKTQQATGCTGVNYTTFIGYNDIDNVYFDGTIDEVKVYNRALTQEEITAEYEAG